MSEITVKAGEIGPRLQGLSNLAEKELPIKAAYKISKIIKALSDESTFYEEAKKKLIRRYAKKDEAGEVVVEDGRCYFEGDNLASFNKEYLELNLVEMVLPSISLTLEDFKDVKVSASELLCLEGFIEED